MTKTRVGLSLATILFAATALGGCSAIAGLTGSGSSAVSSDIRVLDTVEAEDGSWATTASSMELNTRDHDALTETYAATALVPDQDNPADGVRVDVVSTFAGVREFFFAEWINSVALEGTAEDLAAWRASEQVADGGRLSTSTFTNEWLATSDWMPLQLPKLAQGSVATLIHDGGPRLTDAALALVDVVSQYGPEGQRLANLDTTWSVDYRISDAVLLESLMVQKSLTEAEAKAELSEDAQDGEGENTFTVAGKAVWSVDLSNQKIYALSTSDVTYAVEDAGTK